MGVKLKKQKPIVVDMFSGAGGESCGIVQAYHEAGQKIELHAINHWERAIETHSINHPDAEHHLEPIQNLSPINVVPSRRVAMLWASPECTHHSNAAGGRPKSEQSRVSAWLILKWLQELYVERVIVENVPEFLNWGPLGADGQSLKSLKGQTFNAWVMSIKSLGYRVEWRILNAANYGAPTTRKRLFVQAVRAGKRIVWPDPSHTVSPDFFATKPWRTARECIDWSLPSPSISSRKRPLAEATISRIEHGIKKYWSDHADAFFAILRGTSTTASIDAPCPTVTAGGGHIALIQPFLTKFHGGNPNRNSKISDPIPTIDCSNRFGLVEPFMLGQQSGSTPRSVSNPVPTVSTAGAISLCEPFITTYYGASAKAQSTRVPLATVTTKDRFAMVSPKGKKGKLDIGFRMLQPHELSAAQSFPTEYKFSGTKSEQVKQIGNAVPPALARAQVAEYVK